MSFRNAETQSRNVADISLDEPEGEVDGALKKKKDHKTVQTPFAARKNDLTYFLSNRNHQLDMAFFYSAAWNRIPKPGRAACTLLKKVKSKFIRTALKSTCCDPDGSLENWP